MYKSKNSLYYYDALREIEISGSPDLAADASETDANVSINETTHIYLNTNKFSYPSRAVDWRPPIFFVNA